jgi:hypothetical protein
MQRMVASSTHETNIEALVLASGGDAARAWYAGASALVQLCFIQAVIRTVGPPAGPRCIVFYEHRHASNASVCLVHFVRAALVATGAPIALAEQDERIAAAWKLPSLETARRIRADVWQCIRAGRVADMMPAPSGNSTCTVILTEWSRVHNIDELRTYLVRVARHQCIPESQIVLLYDTAYKDLNTIVDTGAAARLPMCTAIDNSIRMLG